MIWPPFCSSFSRSTASGCSSMSTLRKETLCEDRNFLTRLQCGHHPAPMTVMPESGAGVIALTLSRRYRASTGGPPRPAHEYDAANGLVVTFDPALQPMPNHLTGGRAERPIRGAPRHKHGAASMLRPAGR